MEVAPQRRLKRRGRTRGASYTPGREGQGRPEHGCCRVGPAPMRRCACGPGCACGGCSSGPRAVGCDGAKGCSGVNALARPVRSRRAGRDGSQGRATFMAARTRLLHPRVRGDPPKRARTTTTRRVCAAPRPSAAATTRARPARAPGVGGPEMRAPRAEFAWAAKGQRARRRGRMGGSRTFTARAAASEHGRRRWRGTDDRRSPTPPARRRSVSILMHERSDRSSRPGARDDARRPAARPLACAPPRLRRPCGSRGRLGNVLGLRMDLLVPSSTIDDARVLATRHASTVAHERRRGASIAVRSTRRP